MKCEKINNAYLNAAKLVELYGIQFLPVFERLHAEVIAIDKSKNLIDIALSIAKSA